MAAPDRQGLRSLARRAQRGYGNSGRLQPPERRRGSRSSPATTNAILRLDCLLPRTLPTVPARALPERTFQRRQDAFRSRRRHDHHGRDPAASPTPPSRKGLPLSSTPSTKNIPRPVPPSAARATSSTSGAISHTTGPGEIRTPSESRGLPPPFPKRATHATSFPQSHERRRPTGGSPGPGMTFLPLRSTRRQHGWPA